MEIPSIEVKLSRNFCLIDFMNRLCRHFPVEPYLLEQKKYGRKLGYLVKKWKKQQKGKRVYKNLNRFKNPVFESLWGQSKEKLEQQKGKIKNILDKESKSYLKKLSTITKIENFPYRKYVVYLTFPKLISLSPEKYGPTGTYIDKKSYCLLPIGIPEHIHLNNAKDLHVLWHELIHSIAPLTKEAILAWEIVTQIYEEIISKKSRKETNYRITKFFQDNKFTTKEAKLLSSFCLSFKWKKYDIFDFWSHIVKKIIFTRRQKYKF